MLSTDLTTFHLFSKIPKDIRLIIWAYCALPRIITLESVVLCLDFSNPPSKPYFLAGGQGGGGEPPYKHFKIDVPQRPMGPYYTAHFAPLNCATPPAMQSCKEARDVFEMLGYKQHGEAKKFVWNPKVDTVFLTQCPNIQACPIEMFQAQFPAECNYIPCLGIYQYPMDEAFLQKCAWERLVEFGNLQKLIYVNQPTPTHEHEVDKLGQWVYEELLKPDNSVLRYLSRCQETAENLLDEKYQAIVPLGWNPPQIIPYQRRLVLQPSQRELNS
ncbi:hypothetical protein BGZ60DRAFT_397091 [Tricladium varicosporioides]|nr:hypothetical protein BGZ60DRAFT_397091 [Hymenoscyphus varicosporioides]